MVCTKRWFCTKEEMADSSPGSGGKSSPRYCYLHKFEGFPVKKQGKLIIHENVCEWD